jgi:hypothetical protein
MAEDFSGEHPAFNAVETRDSSYRDKAAEG